MNNKRQSRNKGNRWIGPAPIGDSLTDDGCGNLPTGMEPEIKLASKISLTQKKSVGV